MPRAATEALAVQIIIIGLLICEGPTEGIIVVFYDLQNEKGHESAFAL